MSSGEPHPDTRAQKALVAIGIVVLAFNLRPAAVSVGPILDEITRGLGMSDTEAGLLTTLPVLSFATVGALAPRLARVFGLHRLTLLALLLVVAGLGLRAHTDNVPGFLLLSFVGLSGMAAANVLLPSLVKLHFPGRVGMMTSIYSTSLAVGLTSSSVLTVPIAETGGGSGWFGAGAGTDWRLGLFVWAGTAVVAAIPWVGLLRHDRAPDDAPHTIGLADVARTRLGWAMAGFFGLQSLQAYSVFGWFAQLYRDAGFDAHTAGLLLGVITGMSIPLSYLVPNLTARLRHPGWLITVIMACYPIGYTGLMISPVGGAWLWAVVVGCGLCTFPLILTLIGLRARTAAGTAALSGFTQSVGYLIAVVGPFGIGALYDATGGWHAPLIALIAVSVPQYAVAMACAKRTYIEDQLAARPTGAPDS